MSEVATGYDESALEALLQELSTDLPDDVKSLLDKPEMHVQVLQYLNEISSIGSNDYLSSVPPTPAANSDLSISEEKTLVQDIAELEAQQRAIDTNLKALITKSQSSIIENEIELEKVYKSFDKDFAHETKALWRSFKDDDISDIKDDQELYELEIDLDPNSKQDTFSRTIENIKNTQPTEAEKNKNLSVVLQNMDQIIVILELPSLAGACIKAGYYSEALEISSYTRRLAIRFSQSDLIKEVEKAVKSEMSLMLAGLIRLLRTNLKQSSIIKILSYLRRIQPFSQSEAADEQLKRILLHARYQFIKVELESLKPLKQSELHEKYLKRSIEVIREHCFGSIMTYRNIFADVDETELDHVNVGQIIEDEVVEVEEASNDKQDTTSVEEAKGDKNNNEEKEDNEQLSTEVTKEEPTEQEIEAETKVEEGSEQQNNEQNDEQDRSEEPKEPKEEEEEGQSNEFQKKETRKENKEEVKQKSTPEIKPVVQLINNGKKSNILLFDFVQNVLIELINNLKSSITEIGEISIRDGLYLQLIYCSQSLGRIDENFSDLMTVLLLNAQFQDSRNFVIDRKAWIKSIDKQQNLAKVLNR